ncbi:molybdenum cofactor guanylyltransferase MobA [Methylobacterium soli]|uniref:Molybdenum cofactor guanylyltransferase n=1 Tax=Methylobacterium soli TaxID=553447 RepID=A0A6L3SXP5_9HYPH|nr:molybdenum cofactor guanylyltransferase MobA [Methylobacterium soli]KAB1078718.1 molybdenum cofactor guanylyltransferase MobA [Methylobacterium soli]GJE44282.1 Molybdenum cofactor guanylyltransferase [Methylobacterium soli]
MPTLGVILAGGLSRRMGGGDKPLRRLAGRTLLDRVAARFAPQCAAGLILNANGDPTRFASLGLLMVPDGVPNNPGPLAGILAGLDHAAVHHPEARNIVSVTGDAPFLPADLVTRLDAARQDAGVPIVVAASGGRQHFTTALWDVSLRADLREALVERDERRVGAYLARHGAAAVEWPIEPVDPFLNVNTLEDLDRAELLLARLDPP